MNNDFIDKNMAKDILIKYGLRNGIECEPGDISENLIYRKDNEFPGVKVDNGKLKVNPKIATISIVSCLANSTGCRILKQASVDNDLVRYLLEDISKCMEDDSNFKPYVDLASKDFYSLIKDRSLNELCANHKDDELYKSVVEYYLSKHSSKDKPKKSINSKFGISSSGSF